MSASYVLPVDAVSASGPHVFPGLPGVWTPGVAVDAEEFVKSGAVETVEQFEKLVKELAVPVKPAKAKKTEAEG